MTTLFNAQTPQDIIDCLRNGHYIDGLGEIGLLQTPFIYHCKNENIDLAITLVKYGCNVELRDIDSYTGVGYVCMHGNTDFLIKLLEYKVIVDSINFSIEGDPLLSIVCQYNHEDMFDILIRYGADPNKSFVYGIPPLHWACLGDHLNIVDKLLLLGANINFRTRSGTSALFHCRSVDMFYHLYLYGPNLNMQDARKVTPLHNMIITRMESPVLYELLGILLEYGADPNIPMVNNITPLMTAINRRNKTIVEILLKHNADPLIEDNNNKNAIDYANEIGDPDIIDLLQNF